MRRAKCDFYYYTTITTTTTVKLTTTTCLIFSHSEVNMACLLMRCM